MKELPCATGLTGSFAMDQAQHDAPLWRVRRGTGQKKGGVSVRAPNRNPGGSLGCLHERVEAGRGSWWGSARQAQVRENLDDHRRILDRREDGQWPAALRAGGDIDGEDTFESLRPV